MIVKIRIEEPCFDAQGTKEAIAMRIEDFGGKVDVIEVTPEPSDRWIQEEMR